MKSLFILLLISVAVPLVTWANGGDQRIVDSRYLINLSRAPFTPKVGVNTSMLASFIDLQTNRPIAEDLIVKVRISKLGGAGTKKREFLYEKDNIPVKGGILQLSYTFTESGLHEVFFDFAFASIPQKIYQAPDFLLDIQKSEPPNTSDRLTLFVVIAIVGAAGFMIGWLAKKWKSPPRD